MKAPEKIYFSGQQQWSNPFIGLMQKVSDTDIEYIRTDAFVEKACKWLKENAYFYVNDLTAALDEKMLIQEFKDYMKGE